MHAFRQNFDLRVWTLDIQEMQQNVQGHLLQAMISDPIQATRGPPSEEKRGSPSHTPRARSHSESSLCLRTVIPRLRQKSQALSGCAWGMAVHKSILVQFRKRTYHPIHADDVNAAVVAQDSFKLSLLERHVEVDTLQGRRQCCCHFWRGQEALRGPTGVSKLAANVVRVDSQAFVPARRTLAEPQRAMHPWSHQILRFHRPRRHSSCR